MGLACHAHPHMLRRVDSGEMRATDIRSTNQNTIRQGCHVVWGGGYCSKMADMMESDADVAADVLTQKAQDYAQIKYVLDVVVTLL